MNQALESSVDGLQASQGDALRRLAAGVSSSVSLSLADAELSLAAAVRSEAFAALEPVRRLPQLLASAQGAAATLPGAGPGAGALQQVRRQWSRVQGRGQGAAGEAGAGGLELEPTEVEASSLKWWWGCMRSASRRRWRPCELALQTKNHVPHKPQLVLHEERIAALVGDQVRAAVEQVVDARLAQLSEASAAAATSAAAAAAAAVAAPQQQQGEGQQQAGIALSPQQWSALGRRLAGIEQQLQVRVGQLTLCIANV